MRTAVITDTNSGISTEEAAEMGTRSIPMPVLIDGEIYLEGVDLESESFFTSLTEGKAVTTSQPSPGVVCSAWEEALDEGFDNVVYLPMFVRIRPACCRQLFRARCGGGQRTRFGDLASSRRRCACDGESGNAGGSYQIGA